MAPLPSYATPVVWFADLLLATFVVAGANRAARNADLPATARRRVTATVGVVLAGWLVVAFLVADARLGTLHPLVLTMVGGPVLVGYAAVRRSATWRRVVRATPQTWLVGEQAYRTIGALFLVVWAAGGLPAYFALPAGVGDIVTGLGALAVAAAAARRTRWWRRATRYWNLFGLADLVVAVGAGSTLLAGPLSTVFAAETSTQLVVWYPLGMIPFFLVPLSVLLHLYSLTNLRLDSPTVATPATST